MKVRMAYDDHGPASKASGLKCDPVEKRTQEHFKTECDINEIVRRFGLTGELPENPRPPQYGDFTDVHDFRGAMDAIRRAEVGFMEFPAELRARFNHDPQMMLEFLADEKNREEAVRLGLVKKPPEVARDASPVGGTPGAAKP